MPLFGGPPNVEKLKAKRNVKGLIKALRYEKYATDIGIKLDAERLREAAAIALGEIGDARAVEPLITALQDPWHDVQRAAAEALGKIGDARAVQPLLVALGKVPFFVRRDIAKALGEIGDARAVERLIGALKVPQTVHGEPLGKDMRYEAAVALGKIGDARAVEPLIAALKDTALVLYTPSVRPAQAAAEALGKFRDPRAVQPLIIAFKEANPRWGTLLRAYARALTRFGAAGVEFLISTVEDKETDGWRREAAAEVLGQSGDPQAVEPLIAALKDTRVREAALRALQNLGWQPDRSKAGALYWIAARRWDRCVDIGPPAVEPLIVELKDGPTDVRRAAAQALGKIGDPRAGEALIAALRDAKTDVRKAAAQALHDLGWQPDRSGIGVG